jgi:release factor glutamine methyltransferase
MEITIQEMQAQLVEQLHSYSETASLDAQVLLAQYLEKPRSWILAHPEAPLTQTQHENISDAFDRLLSGEPLPYIIGHWEFYGLDFQLTPEVLIPRPETELLVERSIKWLKFHPHQRNAIDVGTGSGCIGISLAKHISDLHMVMTDISCQALEVAQVNAVKHGVSARLEFIRANLLDGIVGPFDLICANLPYIPSKLLKILPVGGKEPRTALDGGFSGTELIGKLLEQGRSQLASGGLILLEIESTEGDEVKALARSFYPLSKVDILRDLSGRDRCLVIERPNLLVHICPREEWLQAQQTGIYRDTSLEQAGVIHCSQPEQVLEVANRFYVGIPELVSLWLDPERLASGIRWENVDGTLFPHIYGPINLDAVISATDMLPDHDGVFRNIQLSG